MLAMRLLGCAILLLTGLGASSPVAAAEPTGQARFETALSSADLVGLYASRVTGEIQRLRINAARQVFLILDTEVGYIQCQPETTPKAIYCEAVSAESWPTAASILTPERLARLHAAGFADPGRGPNYSRTYSTDAFDDAAIARELLGLLHDAYGYAGSPELRFKTEKGD